MVNISIKTDIQVIPRSTLVGMSGEFLGRIGLGIVWLYGLFYFIKLTGSILAFSIGMGVYLIFSMVGSFFGGVFGNHLDREKLIRRTGMLGLLTPVLALIFIQSYPEIYFIYALVGFCIGLAKPLFISHIADVTNTKTRDTGFAVYRGFFLLGSSLGGVMGSFFLSFSLN